jgi:hypothetical protein
MAAATRSPSAARPEAAGNRRQRRVQLLPFQRLQLAFASHIRDPSRAVRPADVEDRRMAIYRELFYNNVEGFISGAFPVLRSLFETRRWHALVRDFFARHRSHTPLFPELPLEFIAYLREERRLRRTDPPFMLELAHYEWVETGLDFATDEIAAQAVRPRGDVLKGEPLVSPLAWRLDYRWPVHRIRPSYQPSVPPPEMTHLVVYRDRCDAVRFLQLNPVTARLLDLLKAGGLSGLQALEQVARELNVQDPRTLISAGADTLRQFRRFDILLGTRA